MTRIAGDLPSVPVVDVVEYGLNEDEIAARFEAWPSAQRLRLDPP
jgi:hypothetical protein